MPDQQPSDPLEALIVRSAEALIARSAAGQPDTAETPQEPREGGLLPSPEAAFGSMLGLVSPEFAVPGAALGAMGKQLYKDVPNLWKNGLSGPYSSEGVGNAITNASENIAADTAKSAGVNYGIGLLGAGLRGAGTGLAKLGASSTASSPAGQIARAAVGPIMKMLGMPTGAAMAAEAASVAAPAVARATAPAVTAAGEALPNSVMEGLRNAAGKVISKFGFEPEAPESMPTTGRAYGPSADLKPMSTATEPYGPPSNPNPPEPPPASANTADPNSMASQWRARVARANYPTAPEPAQAAQDLGPSLAGLHDAVTQSQLSPMDKFYANNPMGSGRTTGSWPVELGQGGLADVTAGRIGPRTVPEAEAITFGKPNVVGGPEPPILDSGFTQGQLPGEIPGSSSTPETPLTDAQALEGLRKIPGMMSDEDVAAEIAARSGNRSPSRVSVSTDNTEFPQEEAPVDLNQALTDQLANLSARRYNTTAPSGLPLRP